jgi:uncharacterized repeat protein (TIGR01451 family)
MGIAMFRNITLLVLFTLLLTPAAFADPDLPGAAPNLESIPIGSLIIPMDTVHQNATDAGVENFNLAAYGLANKMLQNNIPLKWAIRSTKVKLQGATTGPNNSTSLIDSTKNFVTLGVQVGDLVTNATNNPMGRARVTGFATTTNPNDTLTLTTIAADVLDFDNGELYVIDGNDFTATAERIRPGTLVAAAPTTFTSGPFIVSSANPAALAKALEIINGVSDGVDPVLPLFDDTAAQSAVRVYRTTTVTNNVDVRYNLTHKPFVLVSNVNTSIHADILIEAGIPGAAGDVGANDDDYVNCTPAPGDPAFDPNVCNWNQINPLDLSLFECATLHVEPHRAEPGDAPTIALINTAVNNFLTGGGNSAWQCHSIQYLENLDEDTAVPPGKFMTSLGIDSTGTATPQTYPNSPVPFSQMTGPLDGGQGGSVPGWDLNGGTYDKNNAFVVSHNAANALIHKAAAAKLPTGGGIGGNIFYLGGHEYNDAGELEQINGRRMLLNTLFYPADRDPNCGLTIEASLILVKEVINDDGGTADVDDFGITTDAGALVWDAGTVLGDTTTYTAETLTVLAGQAFSLSESDLTEYSEGLWSCEGGDDLGGGAFDSGTVTLAPGDTKTCTISNDDIAQNPDISIDKEGALDLGVDGIANPGDIITYQFSVSNTGDVELTSVDITDLLPGLSAIDCTPEAHPIASIAVGAPPVLCSATYAITQDDIDAGEVNNTASAEGECTALDCPVSDEDPNTETIPASPAVTIDKEGSFDQGADATSTVGDIISYTFDVTNTGNITLTNVEVTDPLVGLSVIDCAPEANPIVDLAPEETVQCTATYAITQEDIDAGSRDNTATVSGDCPSDEDCPVTDDDPNTEEIPTDSNIDLIKTLESPAALQPDGTYTVIYTIQAINNGNALGTYDLVDTFSPGSGITLNEATALYVAGTEITQTGTLGAYPNFVTGETLAAGLDESWEVTANFTVDPEDVSPDDSQCDPAEPVIDTGFYNAVSGVVDEEDTTNNDTCTNLPPPDINLAKTLVGPATLEDGTGSYAAGTYTVEYTITATNNGQGPGFYDLVDTFSPAAGITLNEATAVYVAGTESNQSGLEGAYPNFVTGEALAASLDESWTVTANFTVDPAVVADEDRACDPAEPVINTGFYNAVSGIDEADTTDNDTCTELPPADINLAKTVSSAPVLQGDDTFTVVYQITATNSGGGPGVYDLNDVFGVPAGVTVTPTPVPAYVSGTLGETQTGTLGAFPVIVTAEPLIAGAVETWSVTANFAVDYETLLEEDLACADNTPGQGFYNEVTAITGEDPADNDACAPIPPPPVADARATFTVQKEFMDGNDITEATFRIDCNTGLILDQDKTTHIVPGELYSAENFEVEFVVTDFTQGAMTCTVWEDPAPTGYTPSYDCDSNTLATCDTGDESDLDDYFEGPCVFNLVDTTEIGPDPWQHLCVIRNYPNPVPVVINKDWVIEGSGGDYIDPYYQLKLSCDNEIITEGAYYSYGKWKIVFTNSTGTTNAQYTAMVIPDWDGGTSCEVTESLQDQAVEIDNGCTNLLAQLANGDECTITNTVFFEGIPTLNQYGVALLALLMLGMGLVGFRRFS